MEIAIVMQIVAQIVYWVVAIICVINILHRRLDPARSLSWIAVILMLPVAGIILYLFFGQNFRRKLIILRREIRDLEYIDNYYKKQLSEISSICPENNIDSNKQIITLLLNNSRSILTTDNDIQILHDGKETIESITDAIRLAKKSIHIEYYVFEPDNVGLKLLELLKEKAREGVEVRILYDNVGSWHMTKRLVRKLRKEGVKISCFFPVAFPLLSSRINNRNHRKIVVVDGTVGFTGGINIADRYLSDKWHDTHLKICGSAVKMLQLTFMTDWHSATKEVITNWEEYFKSDIEYSGHIPSQIAISGPDSPWASIMQAYFEAITKARKSIYISTPYFTPTQPILTAIKVAALGGIDVRIMIPKECDVKLAQWATRSYFSELLDTGVGIYLYEDGFIHTKMLCVDDDLCSIGSVNMDERSFEANYEVTAFMYSKEIVSDVKARFLEDCNRCHKLTVSRKSSHALREAICRLLSPIL